MWNIFGDTDDITFGSSALPAKVFSKEPSLREPLRSESHAPSRMSPPPRRDMPPREPIQRMREKSAPMTPPIPPSLSQSLGSLIVSMKPTYLPPLSSDTLRLTVLSASTVTDPLMLARSGDTTILLGTGFGTVENAGKTYPSFPDMRLVQSEKDHLAGWILLEAGFDINLFSMMLEMLGFPFVYGSRDVIAYIRDNVKDAEFLEKCRFFELFSPSGEDRKIADFVLKNTSSGLSISIGSSGYVDAIHTVDTTGWVAPKYPVISKGASGYTIDGEILSFVSGEIIDISGTKISKNPLKFTFDTFYQDEHSIGVVAGYALKDREELGSSGVLTFVLEEDAHARAIVGHIFIDSRGFVHAYEMMHVHKQILKGIRHIYEEAIMSNPRIERGQLVQMLRRDLTKYCYLITGRTPVVMPIIIER